MHCIITGMDRKRIDAEIMIKMLYHMVCHSVRQVLTTISFYYRILKKASMWLLLIPHMAALVAYGNHNAPLAALMVHCDDGDPPPCLPAILTIQISIPFLGFYQGSTLFRTSYPAAFHLHKNSIVSECVKTFPVIISYGPSLPS